MVVALTTAAVLAGCSHAPGATGAPPPPSSVPTSPKGTSTGSGGAEGLPGDFYGVNFDLAGFETFAKADTSQLIGELAPATIRWPGGTEADFYDWHSGQSRNRPAGPSFGLSDLAAACKASGAVPIFDLNVLSPGNGTNPADQVAMLEAAHRLGLPIKYVEIGNELYANGPGFAQAFPDGSAYARTVSIYVQVLHRDFPGVKVGADAIPFPVGTRQQTWDQELLAGTSGAGSPDALIVHYYPGIIQRPFTDADIPALFANVYSSTAQLTQALSTLEGRTVWLTEYNMRGPYTLFRAEGPSPAEGDFAHELYVGAFAAMLPRVAQLGLVDFWTAFADGFYGAWVDPRSPGLTPAGQALEMVDSAAKGATYAQSVVLSGAPELSGGFPGVVGESYGRPGVAPSALLVNLTPSQVALPKGLAGAGTRYQQVSGDPLTSESTAAEPVHGVVGSDGLVLPPYSLTLIEPPG